MDNQLDNDKVSDKELKQFVYIVYILQAVFFLFVVTPIFGMIINFIKKDDLKNSVYASHYRWQQNTFWFGLMWVILASLTTFIFFIGYIVFFFLTFWYIYRIAKGWIYLSDGKELYI